MADLRSRFIEDYAGGLLNVSRQELASTGEVLSQDGFLTDSTIYVEDGVGTKSGLRLGVGLAEVVDPTTQTGVVNVRYADRTYTKIRDTKIFTTAMASAQSALAESVAESLGNIESAIDYLEIFDSQADTRISTLEAGFTTLSGLVSQNSDAINNLRTELKDEIDNVLIGTDRDTNNIRLGAFALSKLTNGSSNVAIGFYSLAELYSGNNNVAIGHQSGLNSIEGSNNILLGADSRLTNSNASNQIILGSNYHDYLWCKTDIYSPSSILSSEDSISEININTTDLLEFIKKLKFNRLSWERGQSHIVVDPDSLKQAERFLSYKGYVHTESKTVSNAKLVPLVLASVSQLLNTLGINLNPITINPITTIPGDEGGAGGTGGAEDTGGTGGTGDTGGTSGIEETNPVTITVPGEGGDIYVTVPDPIREDLTNPIKNFERKFFPIGGIIMWSNYGSRGIPTGWVLCDGRNGTPDLRNKFILGAGDRYLVGQSKEEEPLSPAHSHNASFNAGLEFVSGLKDNRTLDAGPADNTLLADVGAFPDLEPMEAGTEYGPFRYNVTVESGGEPEANKTYPPYYVLAYIMRVF